MKRQYLYRCLQKVLIYEESFRIEFFPHQTLHYARYVHWQCIENDSQRSQPEVGIREFCGVEWRLPHLRNCPVENGKDHKAIPAKPADVYVCDNPVGEVCDCVYVLQRQE